MSALSHILELVSVGDTLRDTAGNRYLLRGYDGHGAGETIAVTRLNDKAERDVHASVAWAMMGEGQLWKEAPKKRRRGVL